MKSLIFLILLTLLASCGDSSGEASATEETTTDETTDQENRVTQNEGIWSIKLDSKDELPTCADENDSQLAYVKDEEAFYVCQDADWASIDISGEQGEKGDQGEQGEQGEDGEDGMAVDNTWKDPVTDYIWLVGASGDWNAANNSCTGSWVLGTYLEVGAAANHGLGVASASLSGPNTAWTSSPSIPGTHVAFSNLQTSTWDGQITDATVRGIFCVKKI